MLTPEEIFSGAIFTYDFTDEGTPICKIEANTARGLRSFSNFAELLGGKGAKRVTLHVTTGTNWLSGWGPTVTAVSTSSLSMTSEAADEVEPSATDVLAGLAAREVSVGDQRRMILAAESLRLDAGQAEALKPLLRRYIDQHYGIEQADERVTVASAVRTYVALLKVEELPAVAALIRAERKAPPSFEMEVAKMITRKLTATLPEDAVALHSLGDELLDLAAAYAVPRLLPKRHCGAVALDSMLSLALMRSRHLPTLTTRLQSIPINWFRATVARQAQAVRAELARKFPAERHAQASTCLGALAAAAEAGSAH